MTVRAIVTDIEGTTSSIRFVHDVLFPYAARALPDFVTRNATNADVSALLDAARDEANEPAADIDRTIDILLGWIRQDRKATPLKSLQGLIWRAGYEQGEFTGHVYEDAVAGLRRWSAAGLRLFVYSSGSVGAQRLLFGYSDAGDLTPLFEGYFDTTVGHKHEVASYARIAATIGVDAGDVLFLSDVAGELDAASAAGLQVCQLVRDADVIVGEHPTARRFDEVIIDDPSP